MKNKKNFLINFVGIIAFLLICVLLLNLFVFPTNSNSNSSNVDNSTSIDGENNGSSSDDNSSSNTGGSNNGGTSDSTEGSDVSSNYLFDFSFVSDDSVVDSVDNIWSDGSYIYYSDFTGHYVLDKETFDWKPCSFVFSGSPFVFSGEAVWSDGNDFYISYYYSGSYRVLILNKESFEWNLTDISFGTLTDSYTIGSPEFYFHFGGTAYIANGPLWGLNKEKLTWELLYSDANFYLQRWGFWTSAQGILYYGDTYIFDPSTLTLYSTSFDGLKDFYSKYVWTYKNYTFYSYDGEHYILDRSTPIYTWKPIDFGSYLDFSRENVWYDNSKVYITVNCTTYQFVFFEKD